MARQRKHRRAISHSKGGSCPSGPWTDAAIEQLRTLAKQRLSAGQIGARLGLTCNAVISKAFRLGDVVINSLTPKSRSVKATKVRARNVRPDASGTRQKRSSAVFETAPIPTPRPNDVARKTFAQIEPGDCRFPVGDVGEKSFGFCGESKLSGLPYCLEHARRCFVPVPVKGSKIKTPDASENASDRITESV